MATKTKSVQFRHRDDILACYVDQEVAPWAIKVDDYPVFKYEGDNLDEGQASLDRYLQQIEKNQSAGIYVLCLYDDMPDSGKINEKTPAGYKWGFRFKDTPDGYVAGAEGRDLYSQVTALKAELAALKNAEPESKLGIIGEIMEMDALQPLIIGISSRLADAIMGEGKVGELKRVSGIPGLQPDPVTTTSQAWREDKFVHQALDRLQAKVPDLGNILDKLAYMAENNALTFGVYLSMLRKKK
jgi:hypothetical protein